MVAVEMRRCHICGNFATLFFFLHRDMVEIEFPWKLQCCHIFSASESLRWGRARGKVAEPCGLKGWNFGT